MGKTCVIEEANKRTGVLLDVSCKKVTHPSISAMEKGDQFSWEVEPDSHRSGNKPVEWPKVLSTEGPSTEESPGSIATSKSKGTTSTAQRNIQVTKPVGEASKKDQQSRQKVRKEADNHLKTDQPS